MTINRLKRIIIEVISVVLALVIFGVPLSFILINAGKSVAEASAQNLKFTMNTQYMQNFLDVIRQYDYMILRAFRNSTVITVLSITLLLLISSLAGFVLQRRMGRISNLAFFFILTGLMIPPAIVPTIWVLKGLGLYKTLWGLIAVETALSFPFATMLYVGYMATVPRELDEAAFIDGCTGLNLFIQIIQPLLKPVSVTVMIITSITVFNDFVNPLYFLPGAKNVTIQLTLYNFMSLYNTKWNLLFADIFLISLPPLLFFIVFNKQIISGMVAGAVKG